MSYWIPETLRTCRAPHAKADDFNGGIAWCAPTSIQSPTVRTFGTNELFVKDGLGAVSYSASDAKADISV